ncbi:MAG: toll/interleukin-1 receptor domain-containing protein [Rhodocyclaceae bacterium]|nr:toll/interleukin-1 receptor domain-containing protein [Rhodocyclaceae bacterium]
MSAIFISYRREDTEGHAGRLFEGLRARFGEDSVFMDVVAIEPGVDFRQVIDAKITKCDVLLALIGRQWLSAAGDDGARRIDQAHDFVRLEIAAALKRGIPVIPVLVQGARMPPAEQLPDDLSDLAFRNAVELTHARWESDLGVMATALARYVTPLETGDGATGAPAASTGRRGGGIKKVLAVLAVVAVGIGALALLGGPDEAPPPVDEPVAPAQGDVGVRAGVDGANVHQVDYVGLAGEPSGYFTQVAPGEWAEFDAGNQRSFTFREVGRDEWSVYLFDEGRGVDIQLDLHTRQVGYRMSEAEPYTELYSITGAR